MIDGYTQKEIHCTCTCMKEKIYSLKSIYLLIFTSLCVSQRNAHFKQSKETEMHFSNVNKNSFFALL